MPFMLFLILNQKAVILRNYGGEQVLLLNQPLGNRTADQTAGNQTKGSSSGTDRGGTSDIEIFQNRTEGTGGTVATDHRNRACTHTD